MAEVDATHRQATVVVATTLAVTHGPILQGHSLGLRERGSRVVAVGHGMSTHPGAASYDAAYDIQKVRARRPSSVVSAALSFRRICAQEQPDLVWLHTSLMAAVGRLAVLTLPPRRRPKVVYLAYGFYFDSVNRSLLGLVFRVVEWALSMVTDHLQTVSREDYERARRLPGRTAANTELTRGLGIDLQELSEVSGRRDEVRNRLGLATDDLAVFAVGQLDPKNRTIDALEAVSALGDGVRLFVIGDGPELRHLEAAAGGLPGPSPVFLGRHTDRTGLLCAADALVYPSTSEGLPSVVLEAQAMGIPVVGARVRGTSDILSDDAGVLVNHRDVPALTAGLREVLFDEKRRAEIVQSAKDRAWQHQAQFAASAARTVQLMLDRAADDRLRTRARR